MDVNKNILKKGIAGIKVTAEFFWNTNIFSSSLF